MYQHGDEPQGYNPDNPDNADIMGYADIHQPSDNSNNPSDNPNSFQPVASQDQSNPNNPPNNPPNDLSSQPVLSSRSNLITLITLITIISIIALNTSIILCISMLLHVHTDAKGVGGRLISHATAGPKQPSPSSVTLITLITLSNPLLMLIITLIILI